MKFYEQIQTPYGVAYVVARVIGGGYLVTMRKVDMVVRHPDYRGGPCINWVYVP